MESKEFDCVLRKSQELLIDFSGYWHVEDSRRISMRCAVLMSELFAQDGYLAASLAKGYRIVEPE